MKKTKYEINLFSFFDYAAICTRLEKRAAQGWMLKKAGFFWKYERIEPQNIHFAVTYFPRASEFDPGPSEQQQTMWEFSAEAGWQIVTRTAQMQIFCNRAEDPVPLETDPGIQVENLHSAMKRNYLIVQVVLLLLAIFQLASKAKMASIFPLDVFLDAAGMVSTFCWIAVAVLCVVELATYFHWLRRARAAAQNGAFLIPYGTQRFQLFILIIMLIMFFGLMVLAAKEGGILLYLIALVYFGAIIVLTQGVKAAGKRMKFSTGVTRGITIVTAFVVAFGGTGLMFQLINYGNDAGWFALTGGYSEPAGSYNYKGGEISYYDAQLPLTVEDLIEVDFEGYSYRLYQKGSPFLERIEGRQDARMDFENWHEEPELQYTVLKVHAPFLYDYCKEKLMREGDDLDDDRWPEEDKDRYFAADADPWGAAEAYRLYYHGDSPGARWFLCYEDRVVEIVVDWEPTAEQMAVVGEKLTAF